MPKKKSIKKSAEDFKKIAQKITNFLNQTQSNHSDEHVSWVYEYGIIRLYKEFENLILQVLVGAVNNDITTISDTTGYKFPLHLSDEVCKYLILGNNHFEYKGRDGLIKVIKKYVPDDHYLLTIVRRQTYRDTLEKLTPLRNYAAHFSDQAKRNALKAVGQRRIGSSGAWLKCHGRLEDMIIKLVELSEEIKSQAPY